MADTTEDSPSRVEKTFGATGASTKLQVRGKQLVDYQISDLTGTGSTLVIYRKREGESDSDKRTVLTLTSDDQDALLCAPGWEYWVECTTFGGGSPKAELFA